MSGLAPSDPTRSALDSPVPYYSQLTSIILRQIETGVLKPDDRLPSEQELEKTYGVSRTVVRHALDMLAAQGLAYRRKGKGTFVAEPKVMESLFQHLIGFYEEMKAKGTPPATQVLKQAVEPAPKHVAQALGVPLGHPVITLVRLRSVNEESIVLSTTYIPEEICPQLVREDLTSQSLYRLLEQKYDFKIARGNRAIEASPASWREARLVKVSPNAPLISIQTVTYLEDGRCLEYSVARHRADRARFEVNLIRRRTLVPPEPPLGGLSPSRPAPQAPSASSGRALLVETLASSSRVGTGTRR